MTAQRITLAINGGKDVAVVTAAGAASDNVIIEIDDTNAQLDIITTLERAVEVLREQTLKVGG